MGVVECACITCNLQRGHGLHQLIVLMLSWLDHSAAGSSLLSTCCSTDACRSMPTASRPRWFVNAVPCIDDSCLNAPEWPYLFKHSIQSSLFWPVSQLQVVQEAPAWLKLTVLY